MSDLLVEYQYFPSVDYYITLFHYKHVIFDLYENYQKSHFCNRCIIAGANGLIKLSVPLIGGRNQKSLFKDLRIDYSASWRTQHLRSIVSSYNRSPFFEHYADSFSNLFKKKPVFLFEWNRDCMEWLMTHTGANWKVSVTSGKDVVYPTIAVTDMRRNFSPKPISTHAGNVTYRQVFQEKNGFLPNLSILDLLFCTGPVGLQNFLSQE